MDEPEQRSWCIERDDGEVMEGPFDTEDEAKRQLHHMYDKSEYRVRLV